jgi:hypothetical protein
MPKVFGRIRRFPAARNPVAVIGLVALKGNYNISDICKALRYNSSYKMSWRSCSTWVHNTNPSTSFSFDVAIESNIIIGICAIA